jgi:heterodisulfide reductase subunit C
MTEADGAKRDCIRASEIDHHFKYEILNSPGGEKLLSCFQCGTCTADCPMARFSDNYRPRQIIRMTQLGLKERVLSLDALWLCTSCFTCTDRCPQDVEVANVIRVLRNLAAQQGYVPGVFKELGSNINKTGYAYRIPQSRIDRRVTQGLPPLPQSNRENLEKILHSTHFYKQCEKED